MPDVQPHYLVSPLFAAMEGEGVVLSISKLEALSGRTKPAAEILSVAEGSYKSFVLRDARTKSRRLAGV